VSLVLAALDDSAAASLVLETAIEIAVLTGATLEAVHVRENPARSSETPISIAGRAGVVLHLLDLDSDRGIEAVLFDRLSQPGVLLAVIGNRSVKGGRRPCGHVADYLLARLDIPVVVVPPEVVGPRRVRCLLLPLGGSAVSSRSVVDQLLPMLVSDVELVVVHVFTSTTAPAMLDRPVRDLEILGRDFLSRHLPHATQIEFRSGLASAQILAVSALQNADLIVLSWSRGSLTERSQIVRELVEASVVPVLLLPVASGPRPDATAQE